MQYDEQERGMDEEKKALILRKYLTLGARQRLKTVSLVKPELVKNIENMIVNMAISGRLNKQLTEEDIKELLYRLSRRPDYKIRRI